jgi:serine/threonine-protein kinase
MHMTMPLPNPAAIVPERNIPQVLLEITRKALEKEADDRYQSAHEFAEALRGALAVMKGAAAPAPKEADGGVVCPSCRAVSPRGQKFCGECGSRLAQGGGIT